jgi:hypothetical protein
MVVRSSQLMSFSTGGLFVNESVEVARIHAAGADWRETIGRALADGPTRLPKAASNRRTLREITNRLSCLTDREREFLTDRADRLDKQALLWLATCRAYAFVREFAVEVIQERLSSYRRDLPLDAFDQFYDAKAEWDERLAAISPTTRRKLRQVLFRMMREAGIINDANVILPAYLSASLRALINDTAPGDLLVFPGLRP